MATAKLPHDAFEFYFGLGPSRSLQSVADRYAVNKKTVLRRAQNEAWSSRIEERERAVRERIEREATEKAKAEGVARTNRSAAMHEAVDDVLTPTRVKALLASIFKAAVQKDDVAAAKFLIERVLGRVRNEPLPATAITMPGGLQTTADVRTAANALLQGVTSGSLSPEDAQKTATILEAARKTIETDELEKRIATIEETIRQDRVDGGAKK